MSDFILRKIEVCGFRGFTIKQEIEFGLPLTILSGGNRRGKSSVLNAVEWCLFGSQVAAKEYGEIRERVNWEVRNLQSNVCYVECEFVSKASRKRLRARRTQGGGKRATDFWFELQGEPRNADEAGLHALLKISPMDFVRAVHLHQEVLRSLITARPGERKEAIDRLLGLSELREVVRSLQEQKPKVWTESLDHSLDDLSTRLQIALKNKKTSIEEDAVESKRAGLEESDLSSEGALRHANSLVQDVMAFASQYQLAAPQMAGPTDLTGLENLLRTFPCELTKLRGQHPVLKNQGDLLTNKTRLEGMMKNYGDQTQAVTSAEKKIKELPMDHQDLGRLDGLIQRQSEEVVRVDTQMREVLANAEVLNRALDYFRNRLPGDQLTCPICGKTSKTVSEWQDHIQSEIEKSHLKPLQERREELQRTLNALQNTRRMLVQLQKQVSSEKEDLGKIREGIGRELSIVLRESDDPAALLASKIKELGESLQALEAQVASINDRLSKIDSSGRVLDRLLRIAKTKREIEHIEQISENQSFKALKVIRQQCEQYVEDVELLVEGLQNITHAEAEKRLARAQTAISNFFTTLTNRPDFPGLRVSPTKDGYAVELTSSTDSREALPILNQGDLNCAALSIFLALATAPETTHQLGFVILDDPSQSLDTTSISNLCKILDAICDSRQLIVGTMDEELREEILKIGKNKKHYLFKEWDHTKGPNIELHIR